MAGTQAPSIGSYRASVAAAWVVMALVVGVPLALELSRLEHESLLVARERGATMFRLIEAAQAWNSLHGGVYVPAGPQAPPNPDLDVPDRDVTTRSGIALTLINPTYMTRQLGALETGQPVAQVHITSLSATRADNMPDPWERAALESFGRGERERLDAMLIDGKPVHRYMAPLFMRRSCLKCHQGDHEGALRGGISLVLPAAQAQASLAESRRATLLGGVLGFLLLGGLSHLALHRNRQSLDRLGRLALRQEREVAARTADLARERARYQVMAELASDWFWEQDEAFRFVAFWGDHQRKGALPVEKLLGRTRWDAPLIGVSPEAMAEHRATLEAHQPFANFEYQIINREGELRWYRISGSPVHDPDGRFAGYIGTGVDITADKRRQTMLQTLTQDTATVSGEAFFEVLVERLAQLLNMRLCFVARIHENRGSARSIAVCDAMGQVGAFEYSLAGTPCNALLGGKVCIYPNQVATRFPQDEMLTQLGMQSYMGVPINNTRGRPVGILAALDTRPLRVEHDLADLMRIFATRAALEFDRMDAERALQESERLLKQAEQIATVGSWELDFSDHSLTWSDETYRIFELDPRRFEASYENFLARVHPADRALVAATFEAAVDNNEPYEIEHRLRMKDGRTKTVLERGETRYDADGQPLRTHGMVQDITERRAAEEKLRLAASVFSATHDGVLITDVAGNIIDANPSLCRMSGYSRQQLLGKNPRIFKSGRQDMAFYRKLWGSLSESGHWQGEITNRRKDGSLAPDHLGISAVRDDSGNTIHYIGVYTDISALKAQQQRLEQQAHHDALTELPNRRLLLDRLHQSLAQAERSRSLVAVAFLDLDGFKPVNDRLGHDAGDELLIAIAQRLRHAVRGGDTVARIGGDEFVLVLVGLQSVSEIEPTLLRVLEDVAKPCSIAGEAVSVTASIGVAMFPEDGSDGATLLQKADMAMYESKHSGRGCYRLFRGAEGG